MEKITIKAYAKLNLTLEVLGTQDGFHQLDSLVTTIDLFDTITLRKRKDNQICVTMHGMGSEAIAPECNNAVKAGEKFVQAFGTTGADVTIFKDIPMGAGLGGSSADASGVLLGMAKLYGVPVDGTLETLADSLGSDTRYLLHGGFMRMQGRGEVLTKVPIDKTLYFLLLCPQTPVDTKLCFARYDTLPKTLEYRGSATQNLIDALQSDTPNDGGMYLMNELFTAASSLNGDVATALDELKTFSPLGACMSGSGSSCFAWFDCKELCDWAKSRYKGKARVFVVKTVASNRKQRTLWRNPFVLTEKDV